MVNTFIGIENEFISYEQNSGLYVPFDRDYFAKISQKGDYIFSSRTAVRTTDGLGFYIDVNEIEVLTPPIIVSKGFATRLTDSLMLGREKLATSVCDLHHTGYSMHWNLTEPKNNPIYRNSNTFFAPVAIPFALFGLTPLSTGVHIRKKGDDIDSRIRRTYC